MGFGTELGPLDMCASEVSELWRHTVRWYNSNCTIVINISKYGRAGLRHAQRLQQERTGRADYFVVCDSHTNILDVRTLTVVWKWVKITYTCRVYKSRVESTC
ncbi:unnamed protein product [Debaryomyces fabryi]|nr:unnamed protein product [Debaryomyces fabryi]